MRVRILPVLIGVAVITLGVRAGQIWNGVATIAEAEDSPAKSVQVGPEDPFADVQLAAASIVEPPRPDRLQLAQAETGTASESGGSGGAKGGQQGSVPANPLSMSDERIELLQQLSKRRKELDKRARKLEQRKSKLQAVEKRLDEKVSKLKKLRKKIRGLIVKYNKQQERQISRLVNIYKNMEPEAAARIFEDLEMSVLLKVVDKMSERNSAPILAQMKPKKAQDLTRKLAERKNLPEPKTQ